MKSELRNSADARPGREGSLPPREAEALVALNSTQVAPGTRALLIVGFLLVLFSEILTSFREGGLGVTSEGGSSASTFFRELQREAVGSSPNEAARGFWNWLPSPSVLRRTEKALEERSFAAAKLRPQLQRFLFESFGIGNEQVQPAPDGWLFFRRDLDYLNGRSFLDTAVQKARIRSHGAVPDSVSAIADFHSQLAARGIHLLVLPVPAKPCIEAHRLRPAGKNSVGLLQNVSYAAWLGALESQGVSVLDPGPLLQERAQRTGEPQFLRTDTHWTPEAMEAVAGAVALRVDEDPAPTVRETTAIEEAQVTAHGDTVALLGLPRDQTSIEPQTVTIRQNMPQGSPWRPSRRADVLLLGDSFSNIYSMGAMGWGESAGFAEHLSACLGRPVDVIARNSDGAFATRQMLQKEIATGNDRLAGKRWVVWEFAVRELAFGDWKGLRLDVPTPRSRTFLCPPPGGKQTISGVVAGVAAIPRPGSVPYREHIVAVHLVDVIPEGSQLKGPFECVVYTWSMREQRPTNAAKLRAGDAFSAEVVPWDDVSEGLERFQRSDLDDPSLLAEPANWAEVSR